MKDFTEFMKAPGNSVASKSQSVGVKGWVYEGVDGKQMAYWICERDCVSKEHVHGFDEYFTVVQGKYIVIINDQKIDICPHCDSNFKSAGPPRFSLHDKYASYRRQMKELAKQKGIL